MTQAVKDKAHTRVFAALLDITAAFPFPVRGIDSDNGSEFINKELLKYCIEQYRSPYLYNRYVAGGARSTRLEIFAPLTEPAPAGKCAPIGTTPTCGRIGCEEVCGRRWLRCEERHRRASKPLWNKGKLVIRP